MAAKILRHSFRLAVFCCLAAVLSGCAQAGYSKSSDKFTVRIHLSYAPHLIEIPVPSQTPPIDLDIAEAANGDVVIEIPGGTAGLILEKQIETSAALGDEGPHLDLFNWKHGYSEWIEMEPDAEGRYRPLPVDKGAAPFPPFTMEELREAVRAEDESDPRWLKLLEGLDHPRSRGSPLYIAPSRVRVRIRRGDSILQEIVFYVPMGC